MEINMKNYNLDSFKEKDIYSWEEKINIIEDLECELHIKEEKIEELENDIESNYERVSQSEQYDISDKDFI